ncbi:MAG: hypothetical protein AABY93_16775 [Bacteroidota bacterium]
MTTEAKTIKKNHLKGLIKRVSTKSKKDPSAFFGKVKDGVDGLAYQKKLRDEWK